jgi:hypothetical protein
VQAGLAGRAAPARPRPNIAPSHFETMIVSVRSKISPRLLPASFHAPYWRACRYYCSPGS